MIQFLINGIVRDRSRSLLPITIIAIGVFLTVMISTLLKGVMGDMIDLYANFNTGHVKVQTKAYAENASQNPNDLALLDVAALTQELEAEYPDLEWVSRIHFGGLMDVADENGETKAQGPVSGMGIDILSEGSNEIERLNIEKSLMQGSLPQKSGDILISNDFANRLDLKPGQEITLFGSTMDGGMAFQNFNISGTVRFGTSALDNGAIIVDLKDVQQTLDMADAAGEVMGYYKNGRYKDDKARELAAAFNVANEDPDDEYAPVMKRLGEQEQMASMIGYTDSMSTILMVVFMMAMAVVLWNTGLLGGLRRYKEFGIRLALGEEKRHIFRTMIYEALLIGLIGSVLGTLIGLGASFYMQEVGLDISEFTKNASLMLPSVYRAVIGPEAFFIGFIPGVLSMVLGTALAGRGIYKRETARLFKELEV